MGVVMRILLVSPPCLGIVYAVFKRGAACFCGGRGALRLDFWRRWGAWADAMGGACLLGRERAGAVARPRERLIGAGAGAAN